MSRLPTSRMLRVWGRNLVSGWDSCHLSCTQYIDAKRYIDIDHFCVDDFPQLLHRLPFERGRKYMPGNARSKSLTWTKLRRGVVFLLGACSHG